MTTSVARVPYLNSAPFFRGLPLGERYTITDCVPRELGERAARGELIAGLLPVADYLRLEDRFERLGPFGIAVRGRAHSVFLFSRKPIRQLDGGTIAVTAAPSTTGVLLRLLLEQRYHISPAAYDRVRVPTSADAARPAPESDGRAGDALVLIGDEALTFRERNREYPFEIDLAFEWWLWQHLPFVFAVWAVRKDAVDEEKRELALALTKALARNATQLEMIAEERAASLGLPAKELHAYLASFIYRLSQPEEAGIARFRELVHEHRLL